MIKEEDMMSCSLPIDEGKNCSSSQAGLYNEKFPPSMTAMIPMIDIEAMMNVIESGINPKISYNPRDPQAMADEYHKQMEKSLREVKAMMLVFAPLPSEEGGGEVIHLS